MQLTGSTIVLGNTTAVEESGNLENFAEVKCPLTPISRRRKRRSTNAVNDPDVLLVSVSMNGGTSYSSAVPVLIYDSSCQNCNLSNSAIKCTLRVRKFEGQNTLHNNFYVKRLFNLVLFFLSTA